MNEQLNQIRDKQHQTWNKFSPGWKKWDELVLGWLAPVGTELLRAARLREDSRLLDVAAGTGEPGLTAAVMVTKGKVTVTDLSEGMLDVAAENAARRGITNLEARQCEAGAMPFADNSFDAVTCRFGFMFFPDVHQGLKEMVRVAKPGARICAAVWGASDKNAWATMVMSTIAEHVELPAPPPGAPGLFRCAASGYMSGAYQEVGLKDVVETEVAGELEFHTSEQYWSFMTEVAAPVVAGLAKADESTREQIQSGVLERAHQSMRDGKVRLRWSATTVSGEKE
jgi:ubiquinone/menaquinone biosynthesis C-methylase UbiE